MLLTSLEKDETGVCTQRNWYTLEDFERAFRPGSGSARGCDWAHLFRLKTGELVATYRPETGVQRHAAASL